MGKINNSRYIFFIIKIIIINYLYNKIIYEMLIIWINVLILLHIISLLLNILFNILYSVLFKNLIIEYCLKKYIFKCNLFFQGCLNNLTWNGEKKILIEKRIFARQLFFSTHIHYTVSLCIIVLSRRFSGSTSKTSLFWYHSSHSFHL